MNAISINGIAYSRHLYARHGVRYMEDRAHVRWSDTVWLARRALLGRDTETDPD